MKFVSNSKQWSIYKELHECCRNSIYSIIITSRCHISVGTTFLLPTETHFRMQCIPSCFPHIFSAFANNISHPSILFISASLFSVPLFFIPLFFSLFTRVPHPLSVSVQRTKIYNSCQNAPFILWQNVLGVSPVEARVCHCISWRPFLFWNSILYVWGRDTIKLFPFCFPRQIKNMNGVRHCLWRTLMFPFYFFFSLCVVYFYNKSFIVVLIVDPWIIKTQPNNSFSPCFC
jgi:hypothetical protein